MINKTIFEVEKDEYQSFLMQIAPEAKITKATDYSVQLYSKNTNKLLCEFDGEHYYIYEMPEDYERIAAKPIQKIVLTDEEDIKQFYKILAQAIKESKDARTVS